MPATVVEKPLTIDQLQARIKELEAANAALSKPRALICKVSEKGAVSVYGLQRMPVTLYGEQWVKLNEFMPTLIEFVKTETTKGTLSTKGQPFEKANNEPLTDAEFIVLSKRDDLTPVEQARINTYLDSKRKK